MKRGFTLIELLVVITVIGLLSLIVVPIVDTIIQENNQKLYDIQIKNIEDGAKNWASANPFALPEEGTMEMTICDLEKAGFIELDMQNPKTGEKFYKDSYVEITKTSYGYTYEYRVQSGSSYECNYDE